MSNKTFGALMVAACMFLAPAISFMWLLLIGSVNWHDALIVTALVVMQYQVWTIRREHSRIANRAVSRALRRHEHASVPLDFDIPSFVGDESLTYMG